MRTKEELNQQVIPIFGHPDRMVIEDVDHELVVDNFSGGGGASTGIEAALGRPIDIAINHNAEAIAMHKVNHPRTYHYNESVWDVDPVKACGGRPVGIAWFSPDCRHHSRARGGKPVKKEIRGLAWVVTKWAGKKAPRLCLTENVSEFVEWGPLVAKRDKTTGRVLRTDGTVAEPGERVPVELQQQVADKKRKGKTFRAWKQHLESLGYVVEHKDLHAWEYGAPTSRKRFFVVARNDGRPIVWPKPTHGRPNDEAVKAGVLQPWRVAADCIDFSLPCPSIFERKKPLVDATMRRIFKGLQKYVIDSAKPFIVTYYGDKAGEFRGQDVNEPLRTQTAENRHALVVPHLVGADHRGAGDSCVWGVDTPLTTVTREARHILIAPTLVRTDMHKSNSRCVYEASEPLRNITSRGGHAVAAATLVQIGYGERQGQKPRVPGIDKPLGTVVAGGVKHALVMGLLKKYCGDDTRPGREAPVEAAGEDEGAQSITVAHIARHFGQSVGYSIEEPARTVVGQNKDSLVTSHLTLYRGTCKDGQPVTEPMPTVTAQGLHIAEVRAFLIKYYGTDQNPELKEPLHTITSKDRFGLVMIEGLEYVFSDIGLRMLTPRELYNAQGFLCTYVIDHDINGKAITKSEQVDKCGNSVPPALSEALVRANYVNTADYYRGAIAA